MIWSPAASHSSWQAGRAGHVPGPGAASQTGGNEQLNMLWQHPEPRLVRHSHRGVPKPCNSPGTRRKPGKGAPAVQNTAGETSRQSHDP